MKKTKEMLDAQVGWAPLPPDEKGGCAGFWRRALLRWAAAQAHTAKSRLARQSPAQLSARWTAKGKSSGFKDSPANAFQARRDRRRRPAFRQIPGARSIATGDNRKRPGQGCGPLLPGLYGPGAPQRAPGLLTRFFPAVGAQ